jgi:hypothetical protein
MEFSRLPVKLIHIISRQFIIAILLSSHPCIVLRLLLHSALIFSFFQMRATLRCALPSDRLPPKHYNDLRYPLTEKLVDVFGGYKRADSSRRVKPKKSHDRLPGKRAEIVSEQLCGKSQFINTHPATSNPVFRRYNRVSSTQSRGVQRMHSYRCSPGCMPVVIKIA